MIKKSLTSFRNAVKWILLPLSILHMAVLWTRHKFYDFGLFRVHRLSRPVISVGNIQMGGTGKTHLTAELVQLLQKKGLRPAVLTRGYRRKSREVVVLDTAGSYEPRSIRDIGDEPALLLNYLQGGLLGVGADRLRVAREIENGYAPDLFVLDDGFQHRRIHRQINICMIDVSRWHDHPFLFPLGYLRDLKSALTYADALVLTKYSDNLSQVRRLEKQLRKRYPVPLFKANYQIRAFQRLKDGNVLERQSLAGQPCAALCGIANPGQFYGLLTRAGLSLAVRRNFPDHHPFSRAELERIFAEDRQQGVRFWLMTEKDAVKVTECYPAPHKMPEGVVVVKVSFRFEPSKAFADWVWERIEKTCKNVHFDT